ncbi:MAG: flagellar type III secretion system pore protein FliP, partial [Lachnospiraceae bacterium]
MKRHTAKNKIIQCMCLLFAIGFLCMADSTVSYASAGRTQTGAANRESNLTGTTDTQTALTPPGTAQTADDLKELNIGNEFTVTYNNGNGQIASTLRILITLTAIALAPIMLLLLTSYTRIIIVLHFTRTALNTQSAPPNQVLIALALFLTFFIMTPVLTKINTEAIQPFEAGQITQKEALTRGVGPLREFMLKEADPKDVKMFLEIAEMTDVVKQEDIPTSVLIPSFVVGELRTAFFIGFLIYIPFLILDMVVSSVL